VLIEPDSIHTGVPADVIEGERRFRELPFPALCDKPVLVGTLRQLRIGVFPTHTPAMSRRQRFRGVRKPCCVACLVLSKHLFLQLWTHKITTRLVLWIQHVSSAPHRISARAIILQAFWYGAF